MIKAVKEQMKMEGEPQLDSMHVRENRNLVYFQLILLIRIRSDI